MAKKMKHPDEDKEYVISTVSRADIRMIMGHAVADRLSADDIERIAPEMSEYAMKSYAQEMEAVINDKFSEEEDE